MRGLAVWSGIALPKTEGMPEGASKDLRKGALAIAFLTVACRPRGAFDIAGTSLCIIQLLVT